tara:strand:- start:9009 stop:9770 length:762 start_codon:yes stop_codon:yes gene_type:complete
MFFSGQFKKFKNINHCFFSKKNGYSEGIYKSLNCGIGSFDKKENIIKNLNLVSKTMQVKNNNLILMNQTHSNKVILVDHNNLNNKKLNADALITKLENVTLGVLTADCVPIILYDKVNHIIGCVHAGWKGAISGIIENTLNKFNKMNKINKIFASVGPCIGRESYEVGIEFYEKFMTKSKANELFFNKNKDSKFLFDIRAYIVSKLRYGGVINVDNVEFDTFKDNGNFFSYRRSQKLGEVDYGRCISTICLKT